MTLRIRPVDEAALPHVTAFNERMKAAGSRWTLYEAVTPDWLPPKDGAAAWREQFVAADDKDGTVRGGFVLKQQSFMLNGRPTLVGNVQGPVSEGIVNRRFAPLGALMLKDAAARQPLQVGWGTSDQKTAVLAQAGWFLHRFPLLLHVVNKGPFLRKNRILTPGSSPARAIGALASLGIAQIGLAALQGALGFNAPSLADVTITEEPTFGAWADEIWERAAEAYKVIAVRDARALHDLMPTGEWPDAIPVAVRRQGKVVGWAAIRDRSPANDPLFGDLRLGSVVDILAEPGLEALTAAAVALHLRRRGVDVIGAAFSHPRWIAAFRGAGFLPIPRRRNFAASPALIEAAGGTGNFLTDAHLTLVDGDGPRVF